MAGVRRSRGMGCGKPRTCSIPGGSRNWKPRQSLSVGLMIASVSHEKRTEGIFVSHRPAGLMPHQLVRRRIASQECQCRAATLEVLFPARLPVLEAQVGLERSI